MIYERGRKRHIEDRDEYEAFKREAVKTERLHLPPTKENIDEFINADADSADDYDMITTARAL